MFRISLGFSVTLVFIVATFGFTSATVKQCLGTCPEFNPNATSIFLSHENCGKYCQCVGVTPFEMTCPPGLHYSVKDETCTYPYLANCHRPPKFHPMSSPEKFFDYSEEVDLDTGCISMCPDWLNRYYEAAIVIAHKECRKFCKCNYGETSVQQCPNNLHFNLNFGGCMDPSEAKCNGIIDDVQSDLSHNCCECPSTPEPITSTSTTKKPITSTSTTKKPITLPPCSPVTTNRPPSSPGSSTPGDISGCKGSCPASENDDVIQIAHQDCTKFCKCDFGIPHVMQCPFGLHYNEEIRVCDRPSAAGCASGKPSTSNHPPSTAPGQKPTSSMSPGTPPTPGDTSNCIGVCPVWEGNEVVQLPHRDCTKFCKCDFGYPFVIQCPHGLHYNSALGVCDRPSAAQCANNKPTSTATLPGTSRTPIPISNTSSTTPIPSPGISSTIPSTSQPSTSSKPSTPGDVLGCEGQCPTWEGDDVVQLPHKDCTKFCKCDFGIAYVMVCPHGLHYNPQIKVCDRPSHAGCAGINDSDDDDDDIVRKNIMGFNRLFRW